MEDGLESKSELADFERLSLLDAVIEHNDPLPVVFCEHPVIERKQGWALQNMYYELKQSIFKCDILST